MINIRKSKDRGRAQIGWLDSYHTFSFSEYYDPKFMGFRGLRVINEDFVEPGEGFPMHPHRDMEIITYIVEGALEHKDSMGNGSVIRPGDVQRMSAGTGVRHSEFNPSDAERVHLLQIWILPERDGMKPGYEQKFFDESEKRNRLRLVAAPNGGDGAITVHADAKLYSGALEADARVEHRLSPGRHAWLQVIKGGVELNGNTLEAGDGAAISNEQVLKLRALAPAELLLFDLA